MNADFDVVVIGGGQAGLATAHCVQRLNKRVVVLDASPRVGHTWRNRYDSLVLFTPAQYDGLPDSPFPAPRDTYPTKDHVADYLAQYAVDHSIQVQSSCGVTSLKCDAQSGRFEILSPLGSTIAKSVVVATGAFQHPFVPECALQLDCDVHQLHSSEYRNPSSIRGQRVAVVGLGNSGAQIAEELSSDYCVTVSSDRQPKRVPQRWLGKDIFWWLIRAGVIGRTDRREGRSGNSARASRLIGTKVPRLLREGRLSLRPRVTGAAGRSLQFADGSSLEVDTVVWATGYRNDYSWVHVRGVIDGDGIPVHSHGVSIVPGLYFIGVGRLSSKGSMFLGFVGREAERLASIIATT